MTDPSDPTGADPAPFILHHYEFSPFSEKVRVAFGIKQIAWRACPQPMMMPKDDLLALTGGYRRIPVLQIGSDLYFDSAFILEEIDRRADGPSLYGGIGAGVGAGLSAWCDSWAEGSFFRCVVGLLFGGDFDPPSGFADDRAALLGAPFDAAAMAAARPQLEFQLRGHLALLEAQLSDGRAYLMGDAPDMTDASFIYLIRMMRNGKGQTATLLEAFPRLLSWEKRLDAVGHG
ncbi:MAG: glutathione S-transferase family protein, partial [Pseudomonadota bacterium]